MKRRLLIIAIFLLLGAVVNVGVAWGCVACGGLGDDRARYFEIAPGQWAIVDYFAGFGGVRITGYSICSKSQLQKILTSDPDREIMRKPHWSQSIAWVEARYEQDGIWFEDGRGWPFISMWWTFRYADSDKIESNRAEPWYVDHDDALIVLRNHQTGRPDTIRALPLVPTWPGFATNTIFYAAILWLLLLGAFALRRFLRVRRGLCPKCAYPMGESSVCTECGITLPRRRMPNPT